MSFIPTSPHEHSRPLIAGLSSSATNASRGSASIAAIAAIDSGRGPTEAMEGKRGFGLCRTAHGNTRRCDIV
jgi:hypothetical protein